MKERIRYKLASPVNLIPGDTLKITVRDEGHVESFEEKIDYAMTVDTIVTFELDEPILGLSSGIGTIFGKAI
jgi:hypothetical protein